MGTSIERVIDATNLEVDDRLQALRHYCGLCRDDKDLCPVCTVQAMIHYLRFFQIVFDTEHPK